MDDRLVARRGSQGDDWHWEEKRPPEPEPPKPTNSSRLSGRLAEVWKALGRGFSVVASAFLGAGSRIGRFFRSGQAPEWPTALPPESPAEPESQPTVEPSAAPEPLLPPPLDPTLPPQRSGVVVPWSRVFPREKGSRPRVAIPWSRISGFRPKPAIPHLRPAKIPDDARAPLLLFTALGLAAAIAIGVVIAVDNIDTSGGGNGIVGGLTETPSASASPAPGVTETPAATGTPTVTPTAKPAPSPTLTPIIGSPAAATPSTAPVVTPNAPQGAVAVALWANKTNAWWFGGLSGAVAQYSEGQEVPLMVRWDGAAGQTYSVNIVYDCSATGAIGAVDYLSGVESWGSGIVYASYGPAQDLPDGAISVPDTSGFAPDDENAGLFTLYGAKFPVLPLAPTPSGGCTGQRTMSLPVQAFGGRVTLLASGHLGMSSVYGAGGGAAFAKAPISISVSVDGVGGAVVQVDPSAVTDAGH